MKLFCLHEFFTTFGVKQMNVFQVFLIFVLKVSITSDGLKERNILYSLLG